MRVRTKAGMARQLIICCDGTNNNFTGRRNDTNVTQLCELLAPEAQNQRLYYDPGVGNPGELPGASWADRLSRGLERLHGLVFGKGIYENIAEAYRFILRNWQPGDEIYLFGFSRGAFTARSVGGLVTQFGILRPDMDELIPTLLHTYFSDRQKGRAHYERIRAQILALSSLNAARDAPVWFVGVWDTVASVGAPFLSREITASPTIVGKNFMHVRQALALDEYRKTFRPRPYLIEAGHDYAKHGQSIKQHWFSGAHCDVGGGYVNGEAGLSQQTLVWMVQEAAGCGLRLRPGLLNAAGQLEPALLIAYLDSQSAQSGPRRRLVHSEAYDAPLWALGGQGVRDTGDDRDAMRLAATPIESQAVLENDLAFPSDTAWRQPRLLRPVHARARPRDESAWHWLTHPASLIALSTLAAVFFWAAAGALLLGGQVIKGGTLWAQIGAMFSELPQLFGANRDFAGWQLSWITVGSLPTQSLGAAAHPARALLADFGFIAAYSYPLAFVVSWAFARIARLRRVAMVRNRMLNILGMAACVAVLADLAENLFGLALLLVYPNAYLPGMEVVLGLCMSAAAVAKWAGLAGSGFLTAWACLQTVKKSRFQPAF